MINNFFENPIIFDYKKPNQEEINWLKLNSNPIFIEQNFRIKSLHSYKEIKLKGVLNTMYARAAVVLKLNQILEMLPNEFNFCVFDAFRTIETQYDLFRFIYDQQKNLNPNLSHAELFSITKEYIVHPDEKSLYEIPMHNSGGAIDLNLAFNAQELDMGTEFDEVSESSQTDWFEQEFKLEFGFTQEKWFEIRKNRRLLFNAMKYVGFVNYNAEWWHYDLGDCHWANTLNVTWFYQSMEKEL
ncbi:M15 family metallopeptidase [Fluviispira multicolorata]|uniref:D-Ala-D-Ala dipeptidase n=1 Tax=Fluviispira multicolorata TaxID=2654512 RepID=A0A833JFD8_9BACT|nr:M15 family metallopeptidase [Fluviispira multicolorata]KAB8033704.1 D-Ala-D-Ala dipeptidase [Fluviispira multicolorata]